MDWPHLIPLHLALLMRKGQYCKVTFYSEGKGGANVHRFYTALVANLKNKYKEIHASAAEVLGMVLNYITEKKHVCCYCCGTCQCQLVKHLMYVCRIGFLFTNCLHITSAHVSVYR